MGRLLMQSLELDLLARRAKSNFSGKLARSSFDVQHKYNMGEILVTLASSDGPGQGFAQVSIRYIKYSTAHGLKELKGRLFVRNKSFSRNGEQVGIEFWLSGCNTTGLNRGFFFCETCARTSKTTPRLGL